MKFKIKLASMIFLISGCTFNQQETSYYEQEETPEVEHNYSEVSEYELTWEAIFDVNEDQYYVYVYSTTCSHCDELKNYIVEKALQREDVYFIKGTSRDQITSDSSKLIGAQKSDDVWILGYPSLLKISSQKVTKNLAGVNQIKSELK